MRLRYLLWFGLSACACSAFAREDSLTNQLLRVEPGQNNRLSNRTYGLGHARRLSADQVLPLVSRYGTPRQQRQVRRYERTTTVLGGLMLFGTLPAFLGTGFIGPQRLALREGLWVGGLAAGTPVVAAAPFMVRRPHRLIQTYLDTLLEKHHYRVPSAPLAWTLADTIHTTPKGLFRYRGIDIEPAEQLGDRPGFSWSHYQMLTTPIKPVTLAGTLLITAGTLVMSYASLAAASTDLNMRRTAFLGGGLLASGFVLIRLDLRKTQPLLRDAVQLHNKQLREADTGAYFTD